MKEVEEEGSKSRQIKRGNKEEEGEEQRSMRKGRWREHRHGKEKDRRR